MSNELMNFEEFRASSAMHEVDAVTAEALLQPGALGVKGWPEWPSVTKEPVPA
jgi:hypothetical protein